MEEVHCKAGEVLGRSLAPIHERHGVHNKLAQESRETKRQAGQIVWALQASCFIWRVGVSTTVGETKSKGAKWLGRSGREAYRAADTKDGALCAQSGGSHHEAGKSNRLLTRPLQGERDVTLVAQLHHGHRRHSFSLYLLWAL
ncbi:hypothetical protein MTO96_027708 [Rhipicephalus appendiculatus]